MNATDTNRPAPAPMAASAPPNGQAPSSSPASAAPTLATTAVTQLRAAAAQVARRTPAPLAPTPITIDAAALQPNFPAAPPARLQTRHKVLFATFVAAVLLPICLCVFYLWHRAADQYASSMAFSVQREESDSSLSLLSGLSSLAGTGSTPDTDIIYNFIYSQQMVEEVQKDLDLVSIWSKPHTGRWLSGDPWYAYDPTGTIEDLTDYWPRMVAVNYDSLSRLIEIRVLAFAPEDANRIAWAIFERSSAMINQLNEGANRDSVRFAQDEMRQAEARVQTVRQQLVEFRNTYQIVDPTIDLASRATVQTALEEELAQTMIQLDLLEGTTSERDPRIKALTRRIEVIENRLAAERAKIGSGARVGGAEGPSMAEISVEYERLMVEREFAEATHGILRASYEAALSALPRQTRYLTAHMLPTRAEDSRYPLRLETLAVLAVFLLMMWSIVTLVFYSLRDRR